MDHARRRCWAVPENSKHRPTIWPAVLLLELYPRKMKTHPHRNSYPNVHSSVSQHCQRMEMSQHPSAEEYIRKTRCAQTLENYSEIKRNDADASYKIDTSWKHYLSGRSHSVTKDNILQDPIYVKYSELANLEREREREIIARNWGEKREVVHLGKLKIRGWWQLHNFVNILEILTCAL